jgi:hypothetical protein
MRGKSTGQLLGRAAAGIIAVGLSLVVSGCDSSPPGPRVSDAGKTLSKDGKTLMDFLSTEAQTHVTYTISNDAGTDEPCGDGKARRTFSAYAHVPVGASKIGLFATAASGQLHSAGYGIDRKADNSSSATRAATSSINGKAHTRFTVVITPKGSQAMNYRLTGHTDCLRSK